MFDEPEENGGGERSAELAADPQARAQEKADQFRTHAELAAVFEGCRKFDAGLEPRLDPQLAREVQRTIGKLEKAREPDTPLLPPQSTEDAAAILKLPQTRGLATNDYHVHRRPGEVMILRWLAGEEVELFYQRLQAHFDAALGGFRQEERASLEWKQDPQTLAYLDALDKIEMKMSDRYLRQVIREHRVFILSTQSADEMDILHLCDFLMSRPAEQIVGAVNAPPEAPTEQDRAWFFKLFSLRGISESVERMCFFTFLQKNDDAGGW